MLCFAVCYIFLWFVLGFLKCVSNPQSCNKKFKNMTGGSKVRFEILEGQRKKN